LASEVVGVFLFTVSRRPPLVGVEAVHLDEAEGTVSTEETSVLVDGCGDVSTGPLAVDIIGVISCCRV